VRRVSDANAWSRGGIYTLALQWREVQEAYEYCERRLRRRVLSSVRAVARILGIIRQPFSPLTPPFLPRYMQIAAGKDAPRWRRRYSSSSGG